MTTLDDDSVTLLEESISPRENLPPLLLRLNERKPEKLDYLGVSFGLTQELLRFWKRLGFTPVYLRQTSNELTGEHSTILLKTLKHEEHENTNDWLSDFWSDFRGRIVRLLGFEKFSKFPAKLAFMIICNKLKGDLGPSIESTFTPDQLMKTISQHDIQRLQRYCHNLSDYHLILDVVPELAKLFFLNQLSQPVELSVHQKLILTGLGLQCKSVDQLEKELDLPVSQILALFQKMMKKFCAAIKRIQEEGVAESLNLKPKKMDENGDNLKPAIDMSLEEELKEAAEETKKRQKEVMERLKLDDFKQYSVKGTDEEWSKVLDKSKTSKSLVSVKSGEKRIANDDDEMKSQNSKKKKKNKKAKLNN